MKGPGFVGFAQPHMPPQEWGKITIAAIGMFFGIFMVAALGEGFFRIGASPF